MVKPLKETGNRIVSTEKILMFDYLNKELVPAPAPDFTINGNPGRLSKTEMIVQAEF